MALSFVSQGNDTEFGTDVTLNLGAINVSVGDLIVVTIGMTSAAIAIDSASDITDSIGNTYILQLAVGADFVNSYIAYCLSSLGSNASNVINIDITGGPARTIAIAANFSVDSGEAVSLDVTTTGASNFAATAITGEEDTTGDDELLIAGFIADNGSVGWTDQEIPSETAATVLTSPDSALTGFYRIVTSTISGCEAEAGKTISTGHAGRLSCFKSLAVATNQLPLMFSMW